MDEYSINAASLLIEEIEAQKNLMIQVATGGPRIEEVDDKYRSRRREIKRKLKNLQLDDPNSFEGLWDWYNYWKSQGLVTYLSRRQYLRDLYSDLLSHLEEIEAGLTPDVTRESTGWERVDRGIEKIRLQLSSSHDEEDYQQVGLLGREVLISLAQSVYDSSRHEPMDGVKPSETDAKRMIDSFIEYELKGQSNKELRSYAKSALDLALKLQHRRTADFRTAAMSAEAVFSVVNTIAIISGRRDK